MSVLTLRVCMSVPFESLAFCLVRGPRHPFLSSLSYFIIHLSRHIFLRVSFSKVIDHCYVFIVYITSIRAVTVASDIVNCDGAQLDGGLEIFQYCYYYYLFTNA